MSTSERGFESELGFSAKWVLGVVVLVCISAIMVASPSLGLTRQITVILVGGILATLSAFAWWLESRHPALARWLAVGLATTVIWLGSIWAGSGTYLALLVLPTALAGALISFPAALISGVVGTALLAWSSRHPPLALDSMEAVVYLFALWCTVGVMRGTRYHMHRIASWSWNIYQDAVSSLYETRARKAELEETTEKLALANRQLALATERISALRLIAEEADRGRAEFVARVSHEFRTPLNMIIGLVSLMVENPDVYAEELPPDAKTDLGIVHRNCKHLLSLINDVLDLSQAEVGRLVLNKEEAKLAEIVESALMVVQPLVRKKRLELEVHLAQNLPPLYCDPTRIRQVVLNLVSNAARFTSAGSITIRVEQRGQHVLLSVTDTGPGIAPEDTQTIFEPFSRRSDGLLVDTVGAGLGLSISKRFVELHSGRMWLESELGVGSSFFVQLPWQPPMGHARPAAHQIKADWVWREGAFRTDKVVAPSQLMRPRAVIWDHNGALQAVLAHSSETAEIVETQGVEQIVDELRRCPAHILILNADSPDELQPNIEIIRPKVLDTPIVACCVPQPADRAIQAGALRHLVKPVTRGDIESVIQAAGRPVRQLLAVDDDPDTLHLISLMLKAIDSKMQVTTALSGEQALEELARSVPDMVLLDLVLPGIDGWQVLKRMRQANELKDIPVCLVSGQDPVREGLVSSQLLATIGAGIPVSRLLQCSLELSRILLQPETAPGRALQ